MLTVTHHNRVWVLCLPAMGRPGLTGQDSIKRLMRGGRGGRVPAVRSSGLHRPEPTEPESESEPESEPEPSCNIAMLGGHCDPRTPLTAQLKPDQKNTQHFRSRAFCRPSSFIYILYL